MPRFGPAVPEKLRPWYAQHRTNMRMQYWIGPVARATPELRELVSDYMALRDDLRKI